MAQKNLVNIILLSIFVVAISSLSAQTSKNNSVSLFRQASVRIDDNQQAPVEVRFREDQKVSVTSFFEFYRVAYNWSENNNAIAFRVEEDNLGQIHHRFKQYYKGVELAEVQYLLHEKEGSVVYTHGKMIHDLDIDITPTISKSDALSRALKHINAESYMWENKKNEAILKKQKYNEEATYYPTGELKISAGLKKHVAENFRLVYRFDIFAEKPVSKNFVDVDAKTGEIVGVLPRMYSDDVQGSGISLYNGEVDIVVADTNFFSPTEPPAHFHVDDWNVYSGTGTSWWMADTLIGTNGGYSDNWYDVLDTDPILLSGEGITLSFRHRYAVEFPQQFEEFDGWDGMNVRISVDDGETWQVLTNPTPIYSNESLYSFGSAHGEGAGVPGWTGVLETWTDVSFDLSAYAGNTVRIRFAFASDEAASTESGGDADWFGWQIDDVMIVNSSMTLFSNDGQADGMTAKNYVREAQIIVGNYRLRESGRADGITTLDMRNSWIHWQAVDFVDDDSSFTDPEDQVGVSTHWAVEATYDYFLDKHGRDSFDDEGSRIISYSNYGEDVFNAQWMGSFMRFGGGDASNGYRSLVAIDIVGHEFSHGVTEFTAGLIYQDEYGALNESFSDIFGEHIEYYKLDGNNDWLMGDESGAIRSFITPNSFGQPDTYLRSMWYTGTADNGGVHINSGVQNFWFYLLSEGGSGVNDNGDTYTVTAIGIEDAAKIAYHNLRYYLMPTSEYEDSRRGSLNAAIDLFGPTSQQFASVLDAWNAVGVYFPFIGPYAENTRVNGRFFNPGTDTLIVTANINNPKNHNLDVKAIIESYDQSVRDTVALSDDGLYPDSSSGDGIWRAVWSVPSGERNYTIQSKTVSLDSGYQNLLKDAATFTTKGPLRLETYIITSEDSVVNPGDLIAFKFTLKNYGQTDTVYNISTKVISLNECTEIFALTDPQYGDLAPGESRVGSRVIRIRFNDCDALPSISFALDISSDGFVFWSDTFAVDLVTGIADEKKPQPHEFALSQNYPNPFNPSTVISYQLPVISNVELIIYNTLGEKVVTLVNEQQSPGAHQIEWDASSIASGVYYYQIKTGDFQAVRKMVLLR